MSRKPLKKLSVLTLCFSMMLQLLSILSVQQSFAAEPANADPNSHLIFTVAGKYHDPGYNGDNQPAIDAKLNFPVTVAASVYEIYIADWQNSRIRKIDADGKITTVVGNGSVNQPTGVAMDNEGNLYITDGENNRILKRAANPPNSITTVAGDGNPGFGGDDGPATSAQLDSPNGIVVDNGGNLYIADSGNNRIRKVDLDGKITTVAGNGSGVYNENAQKATDASLNFPTDVAIDSDNNLYIADMENLRVWKVDLDGNITVAAGNGSRGFSGENKPATEVGLYPYGVDIDHAGNLYISDRASFRILKVDTKGVITSVAGGGPTSGNEAAYNYSSKRAHLSNPFGVAVDSSGRNIYFAEYDTMLIRKVSLRPDAPDVSANNVADTITGVNDKMEYFVDLGNAGVSSSTTWTTYNPSSPPNLSGEKMVYVRLKEDTATDTLASFPAKLRFYPAPPPPSAPNVASNDMLNLITGTEYYTDYLNQTLEYSTDDGGTWTAYNKANPPTFEGTQTVKVRIAEDPVTGAPAGLDKTIWFTPNPPPPAAPNDVQADDTENVIKRTGPGQKKYEYSTDAGGTWTPYDQWSYPQPTFSGNQTVLVRVVADPATGTPPGLTTTLTFTENPEAPNVMANDDTNLIEGADDTMEYSTNDGVTWKRYYSVNPPIFNGFVYVMVRVAAANGVPAGASKGISFSEPPPAPNVTANDDTNMIVGANGSMEYSTDDGVTWKQYEPWDPPTFEGSQTVQVRIMPNGAVKTLYFTPNGTNPAAPGAPNVTANDETDKIIGANATMEYSTNNGTTWTAYDEVNPPVFGGTQTVQVRIAENTSTGAPAGAITTLYFTPNVTNPPAPGAPNVTANDDTNKIVGANATMEYSTNNGATWTAYDEANPPIFEGTQTIQVRVAKNTSTGTPAGAVTKLYFTPNVTNPPAPGAPNVMANDETDKIIGADATMEYSTNNGTTWKAYDEVISPTFGGTQTVQVRVSENTSTGTPAGAVTTLQFTSSEPNPPAPGAPNVTANDETDKIIGTDATMEYSTNNGTTWKAYDEVNPPTFGGTQTVQVRIAENTSTGAPAGAVTTLQFTSSEPNPPAPGAPNVTVNDETNKITGADATMEYSTNSGMTWKAYDESNPPTFGGTQTVQVRVAEDTSTGTPTGAVTTLYFTPEPPTAPLGVQAVAGNGQATISFTPPANNGGSPIKKYVVTSQPDGITAEGTTGSITVTGLTNGTAYTFTVVAVNSAGDSPASAPTTSVTPTGTAGAPSAPLNVTAVAGNGEATISFAPPANTGGSEITGYKVISQPGGITVSGTKSPITITELTNGTAYTFSVIATNSVGDSPASASSISVTPTAPAGSPGAPTNVTAVAGNGQATISFTPPADNGGNPVTEYKVTSQPGGITVTGTKSPITITELTNGTSYTFTVQAINSAGSSAASAASSAVVPRTSGGSNPGSNPGNSGANGGTTSPSGNANEEAVIVLVNGKEENAGKATTGKRNEQTLLTIVVDQKKLDDKLAAEGQGAVVTIPVKAKSDVIIGELNGQMVKNMENKEAVLVLQTDHATYTIPAHEINIDAIFAQLGKPSNLTDIKVRIEISASQAETIKLAENAAAKGTFSLVMPPLEFNITAVYGNQTVNVTKFNAYVERTVAIPDGIDPNKITTGVVIETDGSVRHVPTQVTKNGARYFAKINSLTNSTYAVVWNPIEFSDVAKHWAKSAVNDMGSRMVIDGTGSGKFTPNRDITRAEFAAILVRGLGLKPESGATSFSDVKAADWYSGVINTAYAYGLIDGFEDGTFRPKDKITREQAMLILSKAMVLTGLADTLSVPSADVVLNPYGDASKVAKWAQNGVAGSVQAGIVTGRSADTLAPKANMTRAEVAAIIQRLLQKSELIEVK